MSVQSINDGIDAKIVDTNEKIDKSVEVRRNYHDKDLQKQLADFDKTYLNEAERERIAELNKAETAQLKESNKYAAKTAFNSVKVAAGGVLGKAFGTISAADNSQKFSESEQKLAAITEARNAVRSEAQGRMNNRFDKANELTSNIKAEPEKENDAYCPRKFSKYM